MDTVPQKQICTLSQMMSLEINKKRFLPQWPNHIKPRIGLGLTGRFIKMDEAEENLVLEGYEWKWMGLAALWCNKRNEGSNRLSVNSIRDTLTLHKPFIMMML